MRFYLFLYFTSILFLFTNCASDQQVKTEDSNSIKSNKLIDLIKKESTIAGDKNLLNSSAKGYVLIYAPTLNDTYRFDHKLHEAGMFTYFENENSTSDKVETILIGKQSKVVFDKFIANSRKEKPETFKLLTYIHDADSSLIKDLNINADHLDHGGVAITYDTNGKELFQEIDYKCQGEKLQRMYQHFYPRKIALNRPEYKIEVNQKLPNELMKYVSEYIGKQNVLMTFYPAPLSHSCSIQMETIGNFALKNKESKDLKVIAVSIGSEEQVEAWQSHQAIKDLEMVADTDGSISNSFKSILKDEHGVVYSDRTVFLIDKAGTVKYINQDYDVRADLDILETEIGKL